MLKAYRAVMSSRWTDLAILACLWALVIFWR